MACFGLRAPVYLPDYRPQDFVGRSAYLARLQDALTAEPGVFLLYGEPGSGKSTLALRFAWDTHVEYHGSMEQVVQDKCMLCSIVAMALPLPLPPLWWYSLLLKKCEEVPIERLMAVAEFQRGQACTPVPGGGHHVVLLGIPKGAAVGSVNRHGAVIAPAV